jgi:hypothetical protein
MLEKLSTFWSLSIASTHIEKAMNHSPAHRDGRTERGVASGQRHQCRHSEHRDHRAVGDGLGIAHCLAEETAQVVIASYPLAPDEGLRRRLDPVLRLEGVSFLPRAQPVVLDLITLSPKQILRLQTIGAGVLRHHHPVDYRAFGGRGRHRLLRVLATPIWGL